eukprot:g3665.t1 g3665   contig12:2523480-2523968(-)
MPKTPTNKKPSRVQEYISNIIAKRKRSKAPTSHTNHSSSSSPSALTSKGKKRNHDAIKDVAMDDVGLRMQHCNQRTFMSGVVLPTHIKDEAVVKAAVAEGVWVDRMLNEWDCALAMRLYKSIEKYFDYPLENPKHKKRKKQCAWKTVLNDYDTHKQRFANVN